ncbi:hypothetical protein K7X08_015510 [Anisodus acutangulus]|uniref:Uncharacterized protein n=1 Tax=Anisodus acutangulus TaxID=402998 RepID=A0A9Q1QTN3_9SOLA|nr:hypothetical protein K7X08_015510 [Anisodus acutangulus]
MAVRAKADEVVNLDDVRAVFDDIEDSFVTEKSENSDSGPLTRIEGLTANKAGQFAVVLEVCEVGPSLFMVDVRKAAGDTLEYHKFYKTFCSKIDNIIWKPKEGMSNAVLLRTMTR